MLRRLLVFVVAVALGALTGCGGGGSNPEPGGLAVGCQLNSECDEGLVCTFGRCHAECETSRDCEEGRCVKSEGANVCQLEQDSKCTYDSDCPDPLKCAVDSQCRNQCQSDRDCIAGQKCVSGGVCADPDELGTNGELPGYEDEDGGTMTPDGGPMVPDGGPMNPDGGPTCTGGESCTSTNPCVETAVTECDGDMEQCVAATMHPDGTPCGSGKVCSGGACVDCADGMSCEVSGEECKEGAIDCSSGSPVCESTGNAENGTTCSIGTCSDGTCTAGCVANQPCVQTGYECYEGTTSCTGGSEQCTASSTPAADGTECGTDYYCYSGYCSYCQVSGSCTPTDPCKTGEYSCVPTQYACAETGDAPDGTYCGAYPNYNRVCDGGACVDCQQNGPCTPTNPCKVGQLDCTSGPVCNETANNATDGTECGTNQVCAAGTCVNVDRTLSIEAGEGQSALPNQVLAVVTLHLEDSGGTPVAGTTITLTAQEGAHAPATVTTNASGDATFAPRLGRAVGAYTFTAQAAGASPVIVHATATTPTKGTLYTLINANHSSGDTTLPAAGPVANTGSPRGVAVASDGTLYATVGCKVVKLSPAGELTLVAGTTCGFFGDLGQAVDARLSSPTGLALDEANQLLYVADTSNNVVRVIDLPSGIIDTYAGGGSAPSPGYGDNGPASNAVFAYPDGVFLGPDGALYVSDSSHYRLRRIDPTTTVVTPWADGSSCSGNDVHLYDCYNGCDVVWNADGEAFISGRICGPGVNAVYGIVRRNLDGTYALVAGDDSSTGSQAEGVAGDGVYFPSIESLAMDPAGNLYVSLGSYHKIRRIDGASGKVTTVAGSGTGDFGGEYGPSTAGAVNGPEGLAIDEAGNLYFADYSNYAVRFIWRGGDLTPSTATLSISSGNNQNAVVDSLVAGPFGVKLVDGAGANLRGFGVSWRTLTPGGGLYVATSRTSLAGVATASGRAGLLAQNYQFEASFRDIHGSHVTGSPQTFTVTATAPSTGTIFSIVNSDHGSGNDGYPGPATLAHVPSPYAVEVATDGTTYFSTNCNIFRISPAGELALIGGTTCGFSGDLGLATDAKFSSVQDLALDEANGLLYVADTNNSRVRVIELSSGLVDTFAGGGSAPSPGYGDGGPATAATLAYPDVVSVGPGGHVYISDSSHYRTRRVDSGSQVITAWITNATCSGSTVSLYDCYNGCDIEWDSAGNSYISGRVCASGVNAAYGILRRATNGTLTHIAGDDSSSGSQSDGVAATSAYFPNIEHIARDAAGNIFVTTGSYHTVRRINASNGLIVTVVGNGTAGTTGDFGDAVSALVNNPYGIDTHPNGGFVFADYSNYTVRRVW